MSWDRVRETVTLDVWLSWSSGAHGSGKNRTEARRNLMLDALASLGPVNLKRVEAALNAAADIDQVDGDRQGGRVK